MGLVPGAAVFGAGHGFAGFVDVVGEFGGFGGFGGCGCGGFV